MRFDGKIVLVTGASSGIGAEFARQFHALGANLVLVARSGEKLAELAGELNTRRPDSSVTLTCDLSSAQLVSLERFVSENRIDILVSNAGRGSFGRFENLDRESETEMVQLNLVAPLRLMHAVIPQMKARGEGGIISVSSIAGFQPLPYMATYAATKAFNLIHAQGLRHELNEFGVNVLAVCPGPVQTNFAGVARVPGEWTDIHRDSVEKVVSESIAAFHHGRSWLTPCWRSKFLCFLSRITPFQLSVPLARRSLLGALRHIEKS